MTRHQLAGKHQLFTRNLETGWAGSCPSKFSLSESNMNAAICLEAEGNGHGLQPVTAWSQPAAGGPGRHPWKGTLWTRSRRPGPGTVAAVPRNSERPLCPEGKKISLGPRTCSVPNGSWYIHAGGEEPCKQGCLLKSFPINRRKFERECYFFQLPIESSQGLSDFITQGQGPVRSWES